MFYSALCPPIRRLGSLNSLDLRKIPDGKQSMDTIREWTWYACKDLRFSVPPPSFEYNAYFIPDFMATCTLAYDLDFNNAVVYVPEMRVCHYEERLPSCLTRDGKYSIVRDFVQFLQYKSPYALHAGYNFMQYVRQCVHDQTTHIASRFQLCPRQQTALRFERILRPFRTPLRLIHCGASCSVQRQHYKRDFTPKLAHPHFSSAPYDGQEN